MSKVAQNYFKSLLVKNKKLIILYTFILFVIFPIPALMGDYAALDSGRLYYQMIMIALVIVLPIISFKFNTNKKSVDTYYSLPISRKELFLCHYLAPIVAVYLPMLLIYIIGAMIWWNRCIDSEGMSFIMTIISFVEMMLINLAQYSLSTWAVNKANSFLDSALIALGYAVAPYAVFLAVEMFVNSQLVSTGIGLKEYILVILDLFSPVWVSSSMVFNDQNFGMFNNDGILWILFHFLMVGVFAYLAFQVFKKRKGEDAEQITNNFWTYPFLIHVASICIVSYFNLLDTSLVDLIIYISLSFIIFMIMNFIANRSVKFNWQLIVRYAVIVVLFTGFRYVSQQTYFFGINQQHVKLDHVENIVVEVSYGKEIDEGYEEYRGEKVIDLAIATEKDWNYVEQVQYLQDIAAEKFKNNEYYSYTGQYYNVFVTYNLEGEKYYGEYSNRETRHYSLDENDLKNILKEISFELVYSDAKHLID